MTRKQIGTLLALAIVSACGLFMAHQNQPAEATFQRCTLDGAWLLRFGDALLYQTVYLDPLGRKGTFRLSPVTSNDPTIGGLFPTAEAPSPGALGTLERVSNDTWEFLTISHGRSMTAAGQPGEVIYIEVFEGVATLVDCDTEHATLDSYRVYDAASDADGDGFPDEGAIPILEFEGLEGSAKRI